MNSSDLQPIPAWFDDPDAIGPCPCGMPPDDSCILVEGDVPLKRWFHERCLRFLECEMDEDELQEKREWEERMRENRIDMEEDDDE